MYRINEKTFTLEAGDNIAFIRDGGGSIQLFAGDYQAMQSHDPDGGPHTYIEAEMVVLEVRKRNNQWVEIPESIVDEAIQVTPEIRKLYKGK